MALCKSKSVKTIPSIVIATLLSGSLLSGSLLSSCVSSTVQTPITSQQSGNQNVNQNINQSLVQSQEREVVFINKDEAIKRLSSKDAYINALSDFDWQAIFKSDHELSQDELKTFYGKSVLEWDDNSKRKVSIAVDLLNSRIAELNLNAPKTIKVILTDGTDNGGSAYTREDYIVLPINYIDDSNSQAFINRLVAHEFFHVYSRYNAKHHDKLYATINFHKVPPVVLSKPFETLIITNPDAPYLEYGIDLDYQGQEYTFIPLLQSFMPYHVESNLPFTFYMMDGLLAVEEINGTMQPIEREGEPLFIDRGETNFEQVVKLNTSYVSSPEEVCAENFALWVIQEDIEHPQPVNRLIDVMRRIR